MATVAGIDGGVSRHTSDLGLSLGGQIPAFRLFFRAIM